MARINWHQLWKWMGLFVTLPLSIICGFPLAFTVYSIPLKETFNYTHIEVEMISSAGIVGFAFSSAQASVANFCGIYLTYAISGVTGTMGLLLLWMACLHQDVFNEAYMAVAFFQFLACAGMSIAASLTASISMTHFDIRFSEKIVAAYVTVYALGKVFFVNMYTDSFDEMDNLGGFFLETALAFLFMVAFCCLFHGPKQTKSREEMGLLGSTKDTSTFVDTSASIHEHVLPPIVQTLAKLRGDTSFHLTLWPSVILYSCTVSIMNNFTTMALPSNASPKAFLTIFSVAVACARVIVEMLLDLATFQSIKRKLYLILGMGVVFFLAMIIYLLWMDSSINILIVAIGVGTSTESLHTIAVVTLTVTVGKSLSSGMFIWTSSVAVLLLQAIIGSFLDICSQDVQQENCFVWPSVIITVIVAVGLFFTLINASCHTPPCNDEMNEQNNTIMDTEINHRQTNLVSTQEGLNNPLEIVDETCPADETVMAVKRNSNKDKIRLVKNNILHWGPNQEDKDNVNETATGEQVKSTAYFSDVKVLTV